MNDEELKKQHELHERKRREAVLRVLQSGVKDEVYSLNKEASKRKIEKLKREME